MLDAARVKYRHLDTDNKPCVCDIPLSHFICNPVFLCINSVLYGYLQEVTIAMMHLHFDELDTFVYHIIIKEIWYELLFNT